MVLGLQHSIAQWLNEGPAWSFPVSGIVIASPTFAFSTESTVHAVGVVIGVLATLWPLLRGLSRRSDENTKQAVSIATETASTQLMATLKLEMAIMRREQTDKDKITAGVLHQLTGLHNALREFGDIRDEMQRLTSTVGGIDERVRKTQRDLNALHNWRRDLAGWHTKIEALWETWMAENGGTPPSAPKPPAVPNPAEGTL